MAQSEQGSVNSVYTMRELNLQTCSFTKPEKFSGYHESFITVNGSRGFVLQSPKVVLRNSTNSYFEFLISRNKDRHKEFYNIISHLEDTAIVQISQNSLEWFGKELKRDHVETMFRSSIHRPLEINDPYILRINKVGNMNCEVNYPVVCLIRIDGIIFGRNSSTLDMKVVQIKLMKTEKIPSEDGYIDHVHQIPPEKPFYNDNASVVPTDFNKRPNPIETNLQSLPEEKADEVRSEVKDSVIEKIEELHYSVEQERKEEDKQQLQDIEAIEKVVEKIPEPSPVAPVQNSIEPPSPVKSVQTVRTQRTFSNVTQVPQAAPAVAPAVAPILQQISSPTVDSIKCEIMKAMSDNDFQRVKELSALLQKHKLGSM